MQQHFKVWILHLRRAWHDSVSYSACSPLSNDPVRYFVTVFHDPFAYTSGPTLDDVTDRPTAYESRAVETHPPSYQTHFPPSNLGANSLGCTVGRLQAGRPKPLSPAHREHQSHPSVGPVEVGGGLCCVLEIRLNNYLRQGREGGRVVGLNLFGVDVVGAVIHALRSDLGRGLWGGYIRD
jgi:hypothetical protein